MATKMKHSGLTLVQKIQFMLANGGRSVLNALVNTAYIKYYTDFVGLDPKWLGTVFLIFSIWAAINDPVFGIWMDKQPYRKGIGKFKPAVVKSLPLLIFTSLAFPWASASWSQLAISIYLFIALMLWESAATIFLIGHQSIGTNLFLTTDERTEVEVIDNYVGLLAVFGSSVPIMILSSRVETSVMLIFFSVVAMVSGLIMYISVPQLKENPEFYEGQEQEVLSMKDFTLATLELLKDRSFLLFFLVFFFFQSLVNNYLLGYSYFYDNLILSKGFWTGLPDILIGVMAIFVFPISYKWIKQHGTKKVLFRMMLVALVGYVLLTFVPGTEGDELNMVSLFGLEVPGEASYWLATLMYFAIYFGFVGVFMTNTPIARRLIDNLELVTGQRRPATISGIIGVLLTPGNAVLVFVYTQIISAFGYDGATKLQSATAQWGIRIATGLMPAVMILLGLFFLSQYPIGKEKEDQIELDMLTRHADVAEAK
jgi:glycoside/pentoside/hexuronide:cation symporter, GPH family